MGNTHTHTHTLTHCAAAFGLAAFFARRKRARRRAGKHRRGQPDKHTNAHRTHTRTHNRTSLPATELSPPPLLPQYMLAWIRGLKEKKNLTLDRCIYLRRAEPGQITKSLRGAPMEHLAPRRNPERSKGLLSALDWNPHLTFCKKAARVLCHSLFLFLLPLRCSSTVLVASCSAAVHLLMKAIAASRSAGTRTATTSSGSRRHGR